RPTYAQPSDRLELCCRLAHQVANVYHIANSWSMFKVAWLASEREMSLAGSCRLVVLGVTFLLLLAAICLAVAALLTPHWQVVFISEFHTEHQHGLWMDCIIGKKYVQGASEGSLHCTYKFESALESDTRGDMHEEGEQQHKFHDWHKAVLSMLTAALLAAFIAFCFLVCAACVRISALVANVLLLVAAILSMVGVVVFFMCSHKVDFRFVHGITRTYEQSRGYSFWLAVASSLCYLVAFTSSVLASVLIFVHDRHQHRCNKTFPKRNTAV
ncbi:Clc-like protein 2, partial [Toxocara canis]